MTDCDSYGYIYCLSNEYMNGILKIGMTTTTTPIIRANQLYTTGVPCKFKVEFGKKVKDPKNTEIRIHTILSNRRLPSREFFEISKEDVRRIFEQFEGEWWSDKENIVENPFIHYDESPENENENEEEDNDNNDNNDNDDEDNDRVDNDRVDNDDDDPLIVLLRQQNIALTEQMNMIKQKNIDSINGILQDLDDELDALRARMTIINAKKRKLREDAILNSEQECAGIRVKLERNRVFLGDDNNIRTLRASRCVEHRSSGEKTTRSDGGLPYTKPLGVLRPDKDYELCNTTTRFMFKMNSKKQGVSWCAYCLIDKPSNKIYECDENNTIIGEEFASLNKFCYMVKSRANYGGSMKQNIYDSMKYYDNNKRQYLSLQNLTNPLN